MPSLSVMALFCEDIREEIGGTLTLVGLLPDNVRIEQFTPAAGEEQSLRHMSKLCIYVRINFDSTIDIGEPLVSMAMPDGSRMPIGKIEADIVKKSRDAVKTNDNLLAGVLLRVALVGFEAPRGSIKIEVDLNGEIYVAGALTFSHPPATASPPPS
jgi:hypothetical protein